MEYPIPRSVDDEQGCRRFCVDFLQQLPELARRASEESSEVLVAYLSLSLNVVEAYFSRFVAVDLEIPISECKAALQKEKIEHLQHAVALLCRSASFPADTAHFNSSHLVMAVASLLCNAALIVILAIQFGVATPDAIAVLVLSCVSFALSGVTYRVLTKRTDQERANVRILDALISSMATSDRSGKSMPSNPLQIASNFEGEEGNTYSFGTASFLVEPQDLVNQKPQIDAILMETDDDDGQILVRTRGFSQVSVSLGALNKHLLLVVTDNNGKVTYWSEGSAFLCGFSARDAEGKHISSFLFGENSLQQYQKMTDAAQSGVDPAPRMLSLANLTHGSVAVKASVALAGNSESEGAAGFVLLASSQESDSMRLSQFHNYFVGELVQNTKPSDPRRRTLESLRWKSLQDLAQSSRDWTSVLLQSILSDVVKDRHRQCDVRVQPNVSELVVCDPPAVTRAVIQTLQLLGGKVRMNVSQRRVTDVVQQLVFQFAHTSVIAQDVLNEVQRNIADIGCDADVVDNGVVLRVPFVGEGANPGDSVRPRGTNNEQLAAASAPMTILLLEKNAVYRHNLSSIAWASGHSLRVVDSVAKAMKAVNDSSVDFGCAIIDVDIRDVEKLLEALQRHKIFTIQTSESPDVQLKIQGSFLVKPTTRNLLERELDLAAQSVKDRKKAHEEILRQREIFGKVRNSPWSRGKKLGRGAFADVYEATSTMTGGKMAVKMIRLVGGFKERVKDLMNEIEILCSLSHPHIIHYFYCESAETTINLFMELADEGSLADMLTVQPKLTEEQSAVITKQLLLAVNYLHDHSIIHRDIKPGNMLISKGKIKLSDFGTATNSIGEGTQGTMFYMAPEVVDGNTYGKECDIWSIGCVLCECVGVKRPPRQSGLLGFGVPVAFPPEISVTVQDFISLCLQEDPSERPTAGSLLLHDFIVAKPDSSQIGNNPTQLQTQQWGMAESGRDLSVSSGSQASSRASW